MGNSEALSVYLEEEKSRMLAYFFNEIHVLDLEKDNLVEEEDVYDEELEGINVATLEKKSRLQVVLYEHWLEMLYH